MSKVTIHRSKLDRLIKESGGIAEACVNDTLDETAVFAHQRVHIMSGRTDASIKVDHEEGTVTASWGALWEERRGGSHAFLSNAFSEAMGRANDRVERMFAKVMGRL